MSMAHAMEGAEASRGMTHAELMALPVSFSLDVANRALDLGRTTGFALAKQGAYPVRVLRLGRQYRVTRYDLLRYLGLEADGGEVPGSVAA
ncbi:hypothetical protein SAMN05216268_11212 [Streptomyces yunnanensis]|uniref:Helix-turn-helix domain-containing protein n=1 Tax=Streptomyces yunnanensis TaxID=156453 RepID=A0A9X8QW19_9ACTN|nr:hypothetical protein SAMN05216268_11212 [Streptomyces yunnanensis]